MFALVQLNVCARNVPLFVALYALGGLLVKFSISRPNKQTTCKMLYEVVTDTFNHFPEMVNFSFVNDMLTREAYEG